MPWFSDDTSKVLVILSVHDGRKRACGEVAGEGRGGSGLEMGKGETDGGEGWYHRWNWSQEAAAVHLSCTDTCGIWLPVWSSKEFYNDAAA